ncbi:DUF4352 domain-containing protein [Nocardia carnea]|uniref:DUF4352 domain-containing protein n=1 Tax=Nocardia carnea TaxID=37328 RepID=UPI00245898DF|nr:DUF4352 domain-containing protein [Nocardia carnea]
MTHPPYPPQQPYGSYPPPPPPKKKTWPWLIIPALVLLCGFGGCVAMISSSDKASDTSAPVPRAAAPAGEPAAAAAPESDTAPAGSPVRDGKFEFVVTEVEQGLQTVGTNPYLQKEAQGQYVLVHTTVTNIGDVPRAYFGGNQQLIDAQGREFTNDTMAEVNVNDSSVIGADINPGNTLKVIIAFDVPAGAQPAAIEFHDSAFSGGVKVAL